MSRTRDGNVDDRSIERPGLIGLAAVGLGVVRIVRERYPAAIHIVTSLVREPAHVRETRGTSIAADLESFLAIRPDVVVEAAGHDALRAHGPAVLRAGIDLSR